MEDACAISRIVTMVIETRMTDLNFGKCTAKETGTLKVSLF